MRPVSFIFILLVFSGVFAHGRPARFQQVAPDLFRSAAAANPDDYAFWASEGITTIIDLRHGPDADQERVVAAELGFKYVNIPLGVDSTFSDYVVAEREFMRVVRRGGGVVFHCRHGKDRTGLMAALYRTRIQGWSNERAMSEWRSFGGMQDDWGTTIQDYFAMRRRLPALSCAGLFTSL